MTLLKNIFARIWALWGIISFVATFLVVFIPSMICYAIPGIRGQAIFRYISKIWMNVWLRLIGCPVTVTGEEHFAAHTAYIVTCNHNSLMDVPLSAPYIPGPNKTIAKTSFAKVPLFGWYYRKGSVLVDRNSDKSRRRSYEEMKRVLQQGMHMCLYPEGTRNRGNEPLKKFYDGAFKLSADTGAPIIPAVIFNTKKALPIHKPFYLMPHRLRMHFLPPIAPTGITAAALKEKVFSAMWEYYQENK